MQAMTVSVGRANVSMSIIEDMPTSSQALGAPSSVGATPSAVRRHRALVHASPVKPRSCSENMPSTTNASGGGTRPAAINSRASPMSCTPPCVAPNSAGALTEPPNPPAGKSTAQPPTPQILAASVPATTAAQSLENRRIMIVLLDRNTRGRLRRPRP